MQALIYWKHIKVSDVTTCYQQAVGLTVIMYDEMERHLLVSYLLTVDASEALSNAFKNNGDPEVTDISISSGYITWMKKKRWMITDEYFVMGMNFVHIIKMYHFFRLLICNGDLVMIKLL